MTKEAADGLIVLPDTMFLTQRSQIADLAQKARLSAIYGIPEHAQAGGLMAYAADRTGLFRRAAIYIDKILKGARPGDLAIEQPTKFELVINSEDRQRARHHNPAIAAAARGRGHSVMDGHAVRSRPGSLVR
jgi:putative ABC transport system substrate-binding protein